eukprot:TRINITY_DN9604_c0_g4_i1.p1 TRINITY_DN9604_c0_g4~~TRINITY_DN9604_c0_g4_i1.p1  ORF type:complete len:239 (+),score=29.10 TRINITY_DN9604_c0_g4_i1:753-1469(+)
MWLMWVIAERLQEWARKSVRLVENIRSRKGKSKSVFCALAGKFPGRQMSDCRETVQSSRMAKEVEVVPKRVIPGELFVTRTFGAARAKLPELGGNPNAVISLPEVKTFRIKPSHSFIILGTNGIFSTLSNTKAAHCVLAAMHSTEIRQDAFAKAAECIVKNSLTRGSVNSLTVIVIAFEGFGKARKQKRSVSMVKQGGGKELSARLQYRRDESLARRKSSKSCQLSVNGGTRNFKRLL